MGGLERYLVNFFIGALVGEFGVKKPVLDTFFPLSIYRLILVGVSRGNSVVDSGLQRIFLISFFFEI